MSENSDGTFSIGKTLIIYLGTVFFVIAGIVYAVVFAGDQPKPRSRSADQAPSVGSQGSR